MAADDQVAMLMFEKKLTLSDCIGGLKLSTMERKVGDFETTSAVCYLLNRFSANFNVGKTLTAQQSAMIAADIIEKYPYETLEDIVLMLKMARQGVIGDGKDYKLDGQNILGKGKWMDQYLELKYTQLEREHKQKSDEQKKTDSDPDHPVMRYYAKIRAEKRKAQEWEEDMRRIDQMASLMDRQLLEDTITDWEKRSIDPRHLDYLKLKRRVIKK